MDGRSEAVGAFKKEEIAMSAHGSIRTLRELHMVSPYSFDITHLAEIFKVTDGLI